MTGEPTHEAGAAFVLFDVRAMGDPALREFLDDADRRGAVGVRISHALGEALFQGAQAAGETRQEELFDETEFRSALGLSDDAGGRREASALWLALTRSAYDAQKFVQSMVEEGSAGRHVADIGRVAGLFVGGRLHLRVLANVLETICGQSYSQATRSDYFSGISHRRLPRLIDLVNTELELDPPLRMPEKSTEQQ
jgi:hypothetical protein